VYGISLTTFSKLSFMGLDGKVECFLKSVIWANQREEILTRFCDFIDLLYLFDIYLIHGFTLGE
jgi:hypothetical protein